MWGCGAWGLSKKTLTHGNVSFFSSYTINCVESSSTDLWGTAVGDGTHYMYFGRTWVVDFIKNV